MFASANDELEVGICPKSPFTEVAPQKPASCILCAVIKTK
jgi:hypothetical protein